MATLSIKNKILVLTLIPVIIVTATIMVMVRIQLTELGETEVDHVRKEMFQEKQAQLKDYMQLALTSVRAIQNDKSLSEEQAQEKAKAILHELEYFNGGYIFVFDYQGVALVHRAKPSTVGKNRYNDQDKTGRYLIQDIIKAGKSGGDFVQYYWTNKDDGNPLPKLSYAVPIPEWQWVLGTGFMIDDIEQRVEQINNKLNKKIRNITTLMLITGAFVLGIFAIIASIISARLTIPLKRAADTMLNIAEGEGDLTRRLKVRHADELGALANGFNTFAAKTQDIICSVKSSVGDLAHTSGNLQSVVTQAHQDSQQQNHETQQVAAAIHQMAAAAQEVANSATSAASAADTANQESLHGAQLVNDTIQSINILVEQVNQAGEVIKELDQHAEEISGIITVIQDIAEQTNLLALNAAIEAARAGELGRGFAVVADEVRNLATKTKTSTDEIKQMIDNLLGGVRSAVDVIGQSREKANQTIDHAEQAGQSLDSITQSVSTINEMNAQIATASEQQTSVAEEISRNVQQIADIAENSAKSADQLSGTAQEMSTLENKLSSLVSRFKI